MTTHDYDLVILGGGSAGYAAARTGTEIGLKTAVIDSSETLGGLCILRGCMPSKTLIETANRSLTLKRAAEFGLRAGEISIHPSEIRDRKRRLIGEFADYRQEQLVDGPFDLLRGKGTFLDSHRIEVALRDGSTRTISAATTIIATGSIIPEFPLPGLAEAGFLTSDEVLDGDRIPESIIVLGGGPIALELAHYFDAVDSEVSIIQRSPQILKSVDADAADALQAAFESRGIKIHCGTQLKGVATENGLKKVTFTQNGEERTLAATEILLALGRTPATTGLGLEAAGVDLEGRAIATDATQVTSASNIFAAGDICGPHEVVHIAIEQGEIAATNAAVQLGLLPEDRRRTIDYRLKLFGVFTQPQVAVVGITEKEAAETGLQIRSASYPFDDHGKSIVLGETEGFVKIIADASSGQIVGATVVGPEAVELIHEIVVAMHFNATPGQLATIPHYHPTLSEIWTYPAEELA